MAIGHLGTRIKGEMQQPRVRVISATLKLRQAVLSQIGLSN
jgi:hypothetical protein